MNLPAELLDGEGPDDLLGIGATLHDDWETGVAEVMTRERWETLCSLVQQLGQEKAEIRYNNMKRDQDKDAKVFCRVYEKVWQGKPVRVQVYRPTGTGRDCLPTNIHIFV